MKAYGKSLAMIAVLILVAIRSALLGDGNVSSGELVQIVFAGVAAISVWLAPNLSRYPWIKHAMIGLMAISDLAITYATNTRITGDEWLNLLIVFIGSVFALAAPSPVHPVEGAPTTTGAVTPPRTSW